MEVNDVDSVLGLLALGRANEISFGAVDETGCVPFFFEERERYNLRAFEDPEGLLSGILRFLCFIKTSVTTM